MNLHELRIVLRPDDVFIACQMVSRSPTVFLMMGGTLWSRRVVVGELQKTLLELAKAGLQEFQFLRDFQGKKNEAQEFRFKNLQK